MTPIGTVGSCLFIKICQWWSKNLARPFGVRVFYFFFILMKKIRRPVEKFVYHNFHNLIFFETLEFWLDYD